MEHEHENEQEREQEHEQEQEQEQELELEQEHEHELEHEQEHEHELEQDHEQELEQMTYPAAGGGEMTYPGKFGEVCRHKILMRSCEICELENQIERLSKAGDKSNALYLKVSAERNKLKALLKECREWLDDDGINAGFWTPIYKVFRTRLDKEIQ